MCCTLLLLGFAAVWQQLTTDASDTQDVARAAQRATSGLFAAAAALGVPAQALQDQQLLPAVQLDSDAQAALRQLQERAIKTSTDLFELLMTGTVAEWEAMVISSFQAGVSTDVQESTIQHQVTISSRHLGSLLNALGCTWKLAVRTCSLLG
jgi:hypothetical protein